MENIQKLQLWYRKQCDGSWEHEYGVSIDTLDNPGWTVGVDLAGTDLESMQMELVIEENDEDNWLNCKLKMQDLSETVALETTRHSGLVLNFSR